MIIRFTVFEPPTTWVSSPDEVPVEVEVATLVLDTATGHVTLPGGFVTTLADLIRVVGSMCVLPRGRRNSAPGEDES